MLKEFGQNHIMEFRKWRKSSC